MQCNSVTPFIWLNDTAKPAADFYATIFDDAEVVSEMPGPGGQPMGVTIKLAGTMITLFNGGPANEINEAFSLSISVETQEQVDHFWSRLSEGGSEGPCGWLKDQFGVSWQVVPTALERVLSGPDQAGAQRAGQAMMGMKKLVIAELEAAYAG